MNELLVWAVRERDGHLYIYPVKPEKSIVAWFASGIISLGFMRLPDLLLPEVKWSDEEPTKVKITIERCK